VAHPTAAGVLGWAGRVRAGGACGRMEARVGRPRVERLAVVAGAYAVALEVRAIALGGQRKRGVQWLERRTARAKDGALRVRVRLRRVRPGEELLHRLRVGARE